MSAYFVVELEITNPAAMQPYRDAVSATVEQYGGRYLVLAGATELIEGGARAQTRRYPRIRRHCRVPALVNNSPEYQKILPARLDNSTARAFVVEGVS
jgi:uncharacterized protein (DUF1330 family)